MNRGVTFSDIFWTCVVTAALLLGGLECWRAEVKDQELKDAEQRAAGFEIENQGYRNSMLGAQWAAQKGRESTQKASEETPTNKD